MNAAKTRHAHRQTRPARRRRHGHGHGHGLLIVALLAVLAVAAALAWIAQHLAVLAVIALLVWGAYSLGRRAQGRARPAISPRPGQARPKKPAGRPAAPLPAAALGAEHPAVTLPQADYDWDDQVAPRQAGSDSRDKLLATPMSGARDLWGPS